mmetsp:Transcript_24761/g.73654  ORF Transcript_24761/g.73654 Transcript_24761/m.73654 type:complete len:233 (+) Transcript_24761:571-1269(+)
MRARLPGHPSCVVQLLTQRLLLLIALAVQLELVQQVHEVLAVDLAVLVPVNFVEEGPEGLDLLFPEAGILAALDQVHPSAFVDNADEAVEVQAEEHPGGVVDRPALQTLSQRRGARHPSLSVPHQLELLHHGLMHGLLLSTVDQLLRRRPPVYRLQRRRQAGEGDDVQRALLELLEGRLQPLELVGPVGAHEPAVLRHVQGLVVVHVHGRAEGGEGVVPHAVPEVPHERAEV